MSEYGVIQAIYKSFYSAKLYRDVAVNWGGKALFYLFFLLALSWIAFTAELQYGLNKGYDAYSEKLVGQVPVLTITKGILSTPENRPYIITNPDNHETVAIIDTSGKYTSIDQAKTVLLVTQTEVISKPKPDEIRSNKLPSNLTMVINPQDVNAFLLKYLGYAWILFFPLFLICSFVYRVIEILLYSILGKIFSMVFRVGLSYGQVMQVMMVAITPTIVLATIFDIFHITFNHQLSFYFLLAILYLLYGVISNKNPNKAS